MKDIILKLAYQSPNVYIEDQDSDLSDRIIVIINAVIGVLGLVCVIVLIIGGLHYMTSSGDAAKVKKAKDTILYGIIGLIICVLAFAIVNVVISNILEVSLIILITPKYLPSNGR